MKVWINVRIDYQPYDVTELWAEAYPTKKALLKNTDRWGCIGFHTDLKSFIRGLGKDRRTHVNLGSNWQSFDKAWVNKFLKEAKKAYEVD